MDLPPIYRLQEILQSRAILARRLHPDVILDDSALAVWGELETITEEDWVAMMKPTQKTSRE